MQVNIKKLHPLAFIPFYATDGAAGFDFSLPDLGDGHQVTIYPGARVMVGTGLAFEVPPGFVLLMFSRSGHGAKSGVRLANCVAVIDSDYRGEIMACMTNDGDKELVIKPGDRFAQGVIFPIPLVQLFDVGDGGLNETTRGAGGFGSTGVTKASAPSQVLPSVVPLNAYELRVTTDTYNEVSNKLEQVGRGAEFSPGKLYLSSLIITR